jgi:predicted DNA-binding transcriptional regulator YafY
MRRTDRLFELIQVLRDGRLHRARDLAARLQVSTRTIWRDMDTLKASGIPVEGERGLGYMMTAPITLPPLNLTLTELEALHLGMAVVGEAADPELQGAARSLQAKIQAVLPEHRTAPAAGWGFAVFPFAEAARGFAHMPTIRQAIRQKHRLSLRYRALDDTVSARTVRPLQMEYWGRLWTLTVWCEWRQDFRVFRVDRIEALSDTGETFADESGRTLADYEARYAEGPDGN